MMAPLAGDDHWGTPPPGRRCRHPGDGDGWCSRGVACGVGAGRPMERWCMRRRRRSQALASRGGPAPEESPGGCERSLCRLSGVDYHRLDGRYDNRCCDSNCNGGAEGRSRVPSSLPDRRPRPGICGDDGPSEGRGPDEALRGAGPPPSPSFLAAPSGGPRVAPSSGRGGDGAAVHFSDPGCGGIREDDGVGRTLCGRKNRRRGGGVWCSDGGGVLSRSLLLVSLLWLSLGALLINGASASIMGDGCDWSGSGLLAEMEVAREGGGVGVRPVYLRCSQGAVSWAYPRGALRVLLRLAGGGADEEFRGCVRLGRTWKGARLFLEGVRSLHPLFPGVEDGAEHHGTKGGATGVRCFQSRKGQAALYVEATPGGVSTRGRTVASFEYHLQPLPSGVKSFDPSEECRPCTIDEMTHAFCSSDLVTRGTIRGVESHDDPETSEMKIRVTKLIRRTRAPPPALEGDPFEEEEDDDEEEEIQGGERAGGNRRAGRNWWDSGDRGVSVTLHVPTHCGVRHGAGEFVFMAQRKLGQLRLRCAPRLEDWVELARRANRLAASPCVLQA